MQRDESDAEQVNEFLKAMTPTNPQEAVEVIRWTLFHLIEQMVDEPSGVSVDVKHGGFTHVLEVKVAKADLGKVIGKQGRNVGALRTLLTCLGAKQKLRLVMELQE